MPWGLFVDPHALRDISGDISFYSTQYKLAYSWGGCLMLAPSKSLGIELVLKGNL